MGPENCAKCWGEGRIGNDHEGTPWSFWESLPPGSDLAVRLGFVRPIDCPECSGTGKRPAGEPSADATAPTAPAAPQLGELHGEVLDELIDIHQSPDWADPAGRESLRSRIGMLVDRLGEPLIEPTDPPEDMTPCRAVEVDGAPARIQVDGPLSEETRTALEAVIRAARKAMGS